MKIKIVVLSALILLGAVFSVSAQRKSVSASEVNGTFNMPFKGKFKGSSNEIKILALGGGKLKVQFNLIYPYIDGSGEMTANMGEAEGEAVIVGDTAVYSEEEFGKCRITIKFVKAGVISVSEESEGGGCGFGHNVTSTGTYRKTSSAKPKF